MCVGAVLRRELAMPVGVEQRGGGRIGRLGRGIGAAAQPLRGAAAPTPPRLAAAALARRSRRALQQDCVTCFDHLFLSV